jgi:hypothetical protein
MRPKKAAPPPASRSRGSAFSARASYCLQRSRAARILRTHHTGGRDREPAPTLGESIGRGAERVNDFETPAERIYCRGVAPVCGRAADSRAG